MAGVIGVPSAWAVKAATWEHDQPKVFLESEAKDVVVSSLGEVALGRKITKLQVPDERTEVINALARAGDGKIYAATGPGGLIYQIEGEKVTTFATLPGDGTVLSLLFHRDGQLLAGTGGGDAAEIYQIGGTGKATLFHTLDEATYLWAMARGEQGEIYAATGTEGKLYVIDADGKTSRELVDLKPKNLLCLAFGPDGMLYTGTDEDGLVYRVDPERGSPYVMYDAKEEEISSLVVDAHGNIYAGTAAADQARPGRTVADKPQGKPESTEDDEEDDATTTRPEGEGATTQPATRSIVGTPVSAAAKAQGNAIYRIDTDGFVSEVFRETVMILALAEANGTLYVATGDEGRIYAVTPARDRVTMLARLESSQATALLRLPHGELILGAANDLGLVRLSESYAEKGTLTSKPLDAEQIVKWGRVQWRAEVPAGTSLTVETRSSNVEDEESNAWDAWSEGMDASTPRQVPSPGARFLQYRLNFSTTTPDKTPMLRNVTISYVEENRPPQITSLRVLPMSEAIKDPKTPAKIKAMARRNSQPDDPPEPDHQWAAMWEAEDPNKDTLSYHVYFRRQGDSRWIRMAKDQSDNFLVWDTRTVSDGKYEIRVEASDEKSNPKSRALSETRVSDPITVDNTPPEVIFGRLETVGTRGVALQATLKDALSPITEASYSVNSNEEWTPLAADDDIFDAPTESVSLMLTDLDPGENRIALRVLDSQGNATYVSRSVEITP